jgi:hypothetical protein
LVRSGARALLDDADVEAFSAPHSYGAHVVDANSVLDSDWSKFSASNATSAAADQNAACS